MLELRPFCENCAQALPPDSPDARICSFECTFCAACVATLLEDVCPNCGGGFSPRPIRPKAHLAKHPAATARVVSPVDPARQRTLIGKYGGIAPRDR